MKKICCYFIINILFLQVYLFAGWGRDGYIGQQSGSEEKKEEGGGQQFQGGGLTRGRGSIEEERRRAEEAMTEERLEELKQDVKKRMSSTFSIKTEYPTPFIKHKSITTETMKNLSGIYHLTDPSKSIHSFSHLSPLFLHKGFIVSDYFPNTREYIDKTISNVLTDNYNSLSIFNNKILFSDISGGIFTNNPHTSILGDNINIYNTEDVALQLRHSQSIELQPLFFGNSKKHISWNYVDKEQALITRSSVGITPTVQNGTVHVEGNVVLERSSTNALISFHDYAEDSDLAIRPTYRLTVKNYPSDHYFSYSDSYYEAIVPEPYLYSKSMIISLDDNTLKDERKPTLVIENNGLPGIRRTRAKPRGRKKTQKTLLSVDRANVRLNKSLTVCNNILKNGTAMINMNSYVFPLGSIVLFCGDTIPENWALCDGSIINGKKIPDLRGKFLRGGDVPSSIIVGGGSPHSHNLNLKLNTIPKQKFEHTHNGGVFGKLPAETSPSLPSVHNRYRGANHTDGKVTPIYPKLLLRAFYRVHKGNVRGPYIARSTDLRFGEGASLDRKSPGSGRHLLGCGFPWDELYYHYSLMPGLRDKHMGYSMYAYMTDPNKPYSPYLIQHSDMDLVLDANIQPSIGSHPYKTTVTVGQGYNVVLGMENSFFQYDFFDFYARAARLRLWGHDYFSYYRLKNDTYCEKGLEVLEDTSATESTTKLVRANHTHKIVNRNIYVSIPENRSTYTYDSFSSLSDPSEIDYNPQTSDEFWTLAHATIPYIIRIS